MYFTCARARNLLQLIISYQHLSITLLLTLNHSLFTAQFELPAYTHIINANNSYPYDRTQFLDHTLNRLYHRRILYRDDLWPMNSLMSLHYCLSCLHFQRRRHYPYAGDTLSYTYHGSLPLFSKNAQQQTVDAYDMSCVICRKEVRAYKEWRSVEGGIWLSRIPGRRWR